MGFELFPWLSFNDVITCQICTIPPLPPMGGTDCAGAHWCPDTGRGDPSQGPASTDSSGVCPDADECMQAHTLLHTQPYTLLSQINSCCDEIQVGSAYDLNLPWFIQQRVEELKNGAGDLRGADQVLPDMKQMTEQYNLDSQLGGTTETGNKTLVGPMGRRNWLFWSVLNAQFGLNIHFPS